MMLSSMSTLRRRLGLLSAHLVVAVIALVVIGGATRVMEAGLACPDWPLCFGSFLPGRQMNVQVFLEWFHRLDAFVIGIALVVMAVTTTLQRRQLPRWLPWLAAGLMLLVAMQGALGALTVTQLLPSGVVTAHLGLALTLVALLSGLTQRLLHPAAATAPLWWRIAALLGLAGANAAMILFGWIMEVVNRPGQPVWWSPFWFGCIAGGVPWVVLFIYVIGPSGQPEFPAFVWGILISLFIFFNLFALNQWLQYRGVGRWSDYLYGERVYLVLSLTAKSALAWQVFGNTLAG